MNLLGHGGTTNYLAPLEHQRLESRLGQIERGNESVVSPANDDNSFSRSGHQRVPSPRMAFAAFNPGAPMMPPPGCVADPHIKRLRIGVRYWAHPGTGRRKKSCSSDSSP